MWPIFKIPLKGLLLSIVIYLLPSELLLIGVRLIYGTWNPGFIGLIVTIVLSIISVTIFSLGVLLGLIKQFDKNYDRTFTERDRSFFAYMTFLTIVSLVMSAGFYIFFASQTI